jgi:hypothetical protein
MTTREDRAVDFCFEFESLGSFKTVSVEKLDTFTKKYAFVLTCIYARHNVKGASDDPETIYESKHYVFGMFQWCYDLYAESCKVEIAKRRKVESEDPMK